MVTWRIVLRLWGSRLKDRMWLTVLLTWCVGERSLVPFFHPTISFIDLPDFFFTPTLFFLIISRSIANRRSKTNSLRTNSDSIIPSSLLSIFFSSSSRVVQRGLRNWGNIVRLGTTVWRKIRFNGEVSFKPRLFPVRSPVGKLALYRH